MGIRISTMGVPLFRLHDLEVNDRWLSVDKLTERQRAALVSHAGRYVRVHPDDVTKLGELGLAGTEDGGVEIKKSNLKTDAPKGDATGKAGAKKE